jgi:mono/diheme cytochrome c family protein
MRWRSALVTAVLASGVIFASAADDAGKEAEQRSCVQCHSLRLVEVQRLPPATWTKEVDKMIGWGAVVSDKELLVKYLAEHYSNTQPPPTPVMSADSK